MDEKRHPRQGRGALQLFEPVLMSPGQNSCVRLDALVRWAGAMLLALLTAFASYIFLGFAGAGQATVPCTLIIFVVTLASVGWAWNS